VLIADRSSFRLAKAADCGVDATCNTGEDSLRAASKKLFGNNGFDVAFEAAGSESALDDAVQNIRKGGTIVAVGVFGERPRVDLSILGDRELNLIGSLMYKREDYDQAVQWIASGAVRAEPLITSHFTFERFSDAYRFIDEQADRELRVMIDVG
jgi:threonine dehydrogenase-like Zn-dependent dehydrogenase